MGCLVELVLNALTFYWLRNEESPVWAPQALLWLAGVAAVVAGGCLGWHSLIAAHSGLLIATWVATGLSALSLLLALFAWLRSP